MAIKSRKELQKLNMRVYDWLRHHSPELLDKYLKSSAKKYTLEDCLREARKHLHKIDWQKAQKSTYQSALKNGWIEKCCKHMVPKKNKWTNESLIEDAKKYHHLRDWDRLSPGCQAARSRGRDFFKSCVSHMTKPNLKGIKGRPVKNLTTDKVYPSAAEASRKLNIARKSINDCCLGKQKTAGGFRWAYVEE